MLTTRPGIIPKTSAGMRGKACCPVLWGPWEATDLAPASGAAGAGGLREPVASGAPAGEGGQRESAGAGGLREPVASGGPAGEGGARESAIAGGLRESAGAGAAEPGRDAKPGLGARRSEALRCSAAARRRAAEPVERLVDGLAVRLTRKPVKNLNLRISRRSKRVEVSAPLHVSDGEVERFIREKRRWIEEKQAQLAASPTAFAAEAEPNQLAAWRSYVEEQVPKLVGIWQPRIGVKAGKLAYRNMTSRWGSCQPATGRICINTRLALYPPECLEYVVVHELCHLIERGHGPRFKALLDEHLPDWRKRRAQLR